MNPTTTYTHDCANCQYSLSKEDFGISFTPVELVIIEDERAKPDTQLKIMEATESVAAMLIQKNEKYGDSALNPLGIFSKLDPSNSIMSRLDDKLARIKNSDELSRDDTMDIIGYLVLLLISRGWEGYEGGVEKLVN